MLTETLKKSPTDSTNQRIKRPMNAFMVWSQMRRQEISSTGGKFHNSDISKMLGAEWRQMAEEEKLPYVQKARDLREEHFKEHPDYVYRPRRRKRIQKIVTENRLPSEEQQIESVNRFFPHFLMSQLIYQNLISQMQNQNAQNVPPQESHSPTDTLKH